MTEQRLSGIETRKSFTETLKVHGVSNRGYSACTNAFYRVLLGGSAKQLRQHRGIHGKNLRDYLQRHEIALIELAEQRAKEKIERSDIRGDRLCVRACRQVALDLLKFMEQQKAA